MFQMQLGTLLYDPIHNCWDERLVKAAGTKIVCLPQIYETSEVG